MNREQQEIDLLDIKAECVELQRGLIINLVSSSRQSEPVKAVSYQHQSDYIHFNYLMQGRFEAKVRGQTIAMSPGDLNVGFANGERFDIAHCCSLLDVELMVDFELLMELAGGDGPLVDDITVDRFFTRSRRGCHRVSAAAGQLVHCFQQARDAKLLLSSASLEFLYWHLQAFHADCGHGDICLRERRRLLEARDYLLHDLSAPPTIAEISRKVGLNQFKLKQGFRSLFASSIYACFQAERMRQARQFLRKHNVTETAMMLGYSNVSHFSSAFRKHFGMLPSAVRNA